MRVLVTGSRHWRDYTAVASELDALLHRHGRFTFVHGACPTGADALADRWAEARGVPMERWPADWRHGQAAGPARNRKMVLAGADLCLAFPRSGSRGTWGAVRLARDAGISVQVVKEGG